MNKYNKPQKYHGFDQTFYDYLFQKVITDGGLRLQLIASDLVNQLQKNFDTKDPLNLYRKQYGNIYQALKAMKSKPFFDLDNMVIRMKKPEIVRTLNIRNDLIEKYQKKLIQNQKQQIKIMIINHQNVCKNCNKQYNVNINKPGSCGNNISHQPKYK